MEIDITEFMTSGDASEFSGSIAERGPNAGRETWNNAKAEAARAPMLVTRAQIDALRDEMRRTGAWERAEVDAWDETECNALFIQYVAGDLREAGAELTEPDDFDWAAYEKRFDGGLRFHRGDDGRVYFLLGE